MCNKKMNHLDKLNGMIQYSCDTFHGVQT